MPFRVLQFYPLEFFFMNILQPRKEVSFLEAVVYEEIYIYIYIYPHKKKVIRLNFFNSANKKKKFKVNKGNSTLRLQKHGTRVPGSPPAKSSKFRSNF